MAEHQKSPDAKNPRLLAGPKDTRTARIKLTRDQASYLSFSGLLVSDLRQKATTLSLESFAELYPHPFLICIATIPSHARKTSLTGTDTEVLGNKKMKSDFMKCACLPVQHRPGNTAAAPLLIGRAETNDVVLDYQSVSKVHAHFERVGSDWLITDLGSLNGTFLEESRIPPRKPQLVISGSTIDFSPNFSFFFVKPSTIFRYLRSL